MCLLGNALWALADPRAAAARPPVGLRHAAPASGDYPPSGVETASASPLMMQS
jgi:hypothetical protein